MKIIVFALLVMISVNSFCQQTNSFEELTSTDYLQKSKNQKAAAITLAAGGGVLILFGIPSWGSGFSDGLDFSNPDPEAGVTEMKSATTFFIAGGALILGSVPLFIASAKNKLRSMNLSFKNETAILVQKGSFANRSVPSLTLKISL